MKRTHLKRLPGASSASGELDTKGLPARAVVQVREAWRCIQRGDFHSGMSAASVAAVYAPQHAEPLRLLGIAQLRLGHAKEAVASLIEADAIRPKDPRILMPLAKAQVVAVLVPAAIRTLDALSSIVDGTEALLGIAQMFEQVGAIERAEESAARVLLLDPSNALARLTLARSFVANGRIEDAATEYRQLIAGNRQQAKAWYGLAEIKTLRLSVEELAALKAFCARDDSIGPDRIGLLHALGKAMEDSGELEAAIKAFERMGEAQCQAHPFDADAFRAKVENTRAGFANAVDVDANAFGSEVFFVVGLPRSGSTLAEQILAAHSDVEGASELPDLNAVIQAESKLRRVAFPGWVADATAADWARLGDEYLQRTARWRTQTRHFTDKLPENWELAEAALAMLPGCRIIDCRRDPLETAWSCFKQLFAPGRVRWSYAYTDIATYLDAHRKLMDHLALRYPSRVRIQHYEALIAATEEQTRELLSFCALPFEANCLRAHEADRTVRTASAAQVREPIRAGTARARAYGDLLEPLRASLGRSNENP